MLKEFRTDYNQTHFVRNDTFKKAADKIDGPARKIFIEFLERSCTAEFSGFLLYKELGRRLKKTNPVGEYIHTVASSMQQNCCRRAACWRSACLSARTRQSSPAFSCTRSWAGGPRRPTLSVSTHPYLHLACTPRMRSSCLHRVPRALVHGRVSSFLLYKELGRRLKKTNPVGEHTLRLVV